MTSTSLLASILHVKLRVGCKLPVQIKFKVRITAAGTSRIGIGILVHVDLLVVRFASQREKQQLRVSVSYEPVRTSQSTSYADQDQIATRRLMALEAGGSQREQRRRQFGPFLSCLLGRLRILFNS